MDSSPNKIRYLASCCKKRREYAQARRMVNSLVVTRLLQESRSTLKLSDRVKVRMSDWIAISSGNVDDSEVSHKVLMKLGIHIGELGILIVGSPSQLLNPPSSLPPPRQPIPSSSKENSVEGALPSQQHSSLQDDHPKDIPLPRLHPPLLPQNDNSFGGLPHLPLPNNNLDNGALLQDRNSPTQGHMEKSPTE